MIFRPINEKFHCVILKLKIKFNELFGHTKSQVLEGDTISLCYNAVCILLCILVFFNQVSS